MGERWRCVENNQNGNNVVVDKSRSYYGAIKYRFLNYVKILHKYLGSASIKLVNNELALCWLDRVGIYVYIEPFAQKNYISVTTARSERARAKKT